MENKPFTSPVFPNSIFFFLIAGGIALAIHQFLWNRSLWLDEAMLALNIINRDFSGLLRPLDMVQIAPIGFLQGEKLVTILLGNSDLALRILPLIAYCLSLPLMYRVTERLTRNRTIALMASAIVSITPLFVRYASEVKQYSSDMFLTLAILSFVLADDFSSYRRVVLFGVVGAVSLWFSNTVVIVLTVAGIYLLRTEILGKKNYRILVSFGIISAMFSIYYLLFIHNHPLSGAMRDFWSTSFQPINPLQIDFFLFPLKGLAVIFKAFFDSWITGPLMLLVATYACVRLVHNREYRIIYFCLMPFILHWLLSAVQLYPFPVKPSQTRMILYAVPLLSIMLSTGLSDLFRKISQRTGKANHPGMIVLVLFLMAGIWHHPFEFEEIKKSLDHINNSPHYGQSLYVYRPAKDAFNFYQQTRPLKKKLPVVIGTKRWHASLPLSIYDDELRNLQGDVWLLFSHWRKNEEIRYIIRTLRKQGGKVVEEKHFRGSCVYLLRLVKKT